MKPLSQPRSATLATFARGALSLTLTVFAVACAPDVGLPVRASALRAFSATPAIEDSTSTIDRQPTFALQFDRVMNVVEDGVWLVEGAPSDSLRSDARRGALSASNAARRIRATVERDPEQPFTLRVRPDEPLWPGQSVVLLTTAKLLDDEGLVASEDAVNPSPVVRAFRVCSPSDCRPIATLSSPRVRDVPFALGTVRVRFDRPIVPAVEGPVVWLERARDGEEIPGNGALDCRDGNGWRCVRFIPDVELEPETDYRVRLGVLVDSDGREVTPTTRSFRTGTTRAAPAPSFINAGVCGVGERSVPPLCLSVRHGAINVTARSDWNATLHLRAGEWEADSDVGTVLSATIAPTTPNAHTPIIATLLSEDATLTREVRIDPIVTPPRVARVRISEVYARPRSGAAQEFVELVNDDDSPLNLQGLSLFTDGGHSDLPDVTVPSGARVVIVGPAFDVRGDLRAGDAALAPGAVLVRLERTLAQRGLADRGGDVWLADSAGIVVSRAPLSHPARAPRVGVSVIRADTRMREDDPASWTYDAGEGSTPGAPDRLR
ncbi:MAG: lamin tail domain-containing protein [Polyangiales bacterium]